MLLIDNYDSFTYNLADLIYQAFGQEADVVCNDADWQAIDLADYDLAVISPGPGTPTRPADVGISAQLLEQCREGSQVPVLGVCLGHQLIAHAFGGTVAHAAEPVHGQLAWVKHEGTGLFSGLENPLPSVRYHSLAATSLPDCLTATAWTDDGTVMALAHTELPFAGVQFHPESISSAGGVELLRNFAVQYCGAQQLRWQEVPYPTSAEQLFDELFRREECAVWLDSSLPDAQYGRYSVMATGPQVAAADLPAMQAQLDAMAVLDDATAPFPFRPGLVGALDYELAKPVMLQCERAVVLDHVDLRAYVVGTEGAERAGSAGSTSGTLAAWAAEVSSVVRSLPEDEPEDELKEASQVQLDASAPSLEFTFDLSKSEYLAAIATAQQHIVDGESYELCLTNTARAATLPDPWQTYRRLRQVSPVPFGGYLQTPEVTLLCASPERFMQVSADGHAQARPIKGTRPRGATAAEDTELIVDLAQAVKDRSENLMIVDLLRNDLTQVCRPGSVQVPELFEVETFAQVHQLVSTITGELRPDATATEAIAAAFPGGSMTGAPKVRTMQLIDDLEPNPRGYYSGALGWFGATGSADFNIVIRSLVATKTETSFGVGGAIVHLSDPEAEFEETLVKARAVLAATNGTLTF